MPSKEDEGQDIIYDNVEIKPAPPGFVGRCLRRISEKAGKYLRPNGRRGPGWRIIKGVTKK